MARYYGLYNTGKKAELKSCMEELSQEPIDEVEFLDWQTYCEGRGEKHPERCPICGKRLICLSVIPEWRGNVFKKTASFHEAA